MLIKWFIWHLFRGYDRALTLIRTSPFSFCISPNMAWIRELLPAPTVPTTATSSPEDTDMLMLENQDELQILYWNIHTMGVDEIIIYFRCAWIYHPGGLYWNYYTDILVKPLQLIRRSCTLRWNLRTRTRSPNELQRLHWMIFSLSKKRCWIVVT